MNSPNLPNRIIPQAKNFKELLNRITECKTFFLLFNNLIKKLNQRKSIDFMDYIFER